MANEKDPGVDGGTSTLNNDWAQSVRYGRKGTEDVCTEGLMSSR